MAKRLLCVFLSVLMVVAMLPMGAVAADSGATVLAYQTTTGNLYILKNADFTDESLYLYINYTLDDSDYSYNGPASLCDTGWSNVVYVDSYNSCSGTYVISLVELASQFSEAGYDATSGVVLNWWGTSYSTFVSAQLVDSDYSEVASQTTTGTLSILDGVDFTDPDLYLYVLFTMNDDYADSNYIYWSLANFYVTDESLEDGYTNVGSGISTFSACGGFYSISLVDLASMWESAGYSAAEAGVCLSFWGSTYGTLTKVALIDVGETSSDDDDDDDDDDGEEEDTAIWTFTGTADEEGDVTVSNSPFAFTPSDYYTGTADFSQYVGTGTEFTITVTFEYDCSYFGGIIGANSYESYNAGGEYSGWSNGDSYTQATTWTRTIDLMYDTAQVQMWWMGEGTVSITNIEVTFDADEDDTTASFVTRTLSLGGKIGINYYVDFTDVENPEDYSVVFTLASGDTQTVAYSDATSGNMSTSDSIVKFTCRINCWNMGTTVTATLMNGDEEVQTISNYSIETYATNVSGRNDNLDDLLKAMLTFGYYTNAYKNDGVDVSSYEDGTGDVDAETLEEYKATVTSGDSSVVTANLVLDDTCELDFTLGEDYSDYTITIDGVATDKITDILVENWDTEHTVVVTNTDGESVCEFTYSVLSYAYTVVEADEDSDLVDLVKAMYLYNQYADAYFG